jgi:hypothetical protein
LGFSSAAPARKATKQQAIVTNKKPNLAIHGMLKDSEEARGWFIKADKHTTRLGKPGHLGGLFGRPPAEVSNRSPAGDFINTQVLWWQGVSVLRVLHGGIVKIGRF